MVFGFMYYTKHGNILMLEFDYSLNYKRIKFKPNDSRYRIGRGEQGVLSSLVMIIPLLIAVTRP